MRGRINALAPRTKGILFAVDGQGERWFRAASDNVFSYAKKGEAEVELDPTSTTIVKVTALSTQSNESETMGGSQRFVHHKEPSTFTYDREKKIIRQSCLKMAVELVVAERIHMDQVYTIAEALENWVNRGE